jgi:predicted RNase H-like nuclease
VELAEGAFVAAHLAASLAELIEWVPDAVAVGVDMPLGLVERGWRAADLAAAAVLGRRRSSVFRVPPRQVWDEPEFEAANRRCRQLTGGGLTRQAWALREKLREANDCWRGSGAPMYEVHPEVSFRQMAGAALPHPKTTWYGQTMRRDLLAAHGVVVPDELGEAGYAAPDDVLDAGAAAWSAHRIATGRAVSYPDPPERTETGEQIAIWT